MAITDILTNKVKDVVAISQNVAKVVKDEIEMNLNNRNDDDHDYEEKRNFSDYRATLTSYFETFETKAKDLVQNTFSGFSSSKSEEQEELERRIAALEAKLSQLVEESLDSIRKNDN